MVYSRRIESLWPSAGVAMRGMAREYAAGDSRGLGWREFAGTFGCPLGGPVAGRPSGGEWNGSQPGQGPAELGFPGPMLGKMQSEAACRAGEPSGQGEEPPPEGLGGHDLLAQADAGRPAGEVVGHHLDGQPSGVGGESAGQHVVQPDAVLEVPDGVLDLGVAAAELLGQLLLQDVERAGDGVNLRDGVSRDRMMSVHDPEMRHGHKSSRRRFDGHKAAIVVDTDSQLITAVDVLPGNAPDNLGALELVEQSEANTGVPVEESMGDAAYGDGDTRQSFADAGRTLIARVPGRPNRAHFPKEDFRIDLEAGSCTCPAGNVTRTILPAGRGTNSAGRIYQRVAFRFDAAVCGCKRRR